MTHGRAHGGAAEQHDGTWRLRWPDGTEMASVVFAAREAEAHPDATHLTLDDPRLRALVTSLPRFVPGQPIPTVTLADLQESVRGIWSLWRIVLHAGEVEKQRIMPLFVHDDGRVLVPTARFVWDKLLEEEPGVAQSTSGDDAARVLTEMQRLAEEHGRALWEELLQAHQTRLDRGRAKGEQSYAARRRALGRIGLAAVRAHRIAKLDEEEHFWRAGLEAQRTALPELLPILMVRVERGT